MRELVLTYRVHLGWAFVRITNIVFVPERVFDSVFPENLSRFAFFAKTKHSWTAVSGLKSKIQVISRIFVRYL